MKKTVSENKLAKGRGLEDKYIPLFKPVEEKGKDVSKEEFLGKYDSKDPKYCPSSK